MEFTERTLDEHIINDFCKTGALFVVNHSGGKDSQAMLIHLLNEGIPPGQIVIMHADLGAADWPGVLDHIRATTLGLPLVVAQATKSFMDMVRSRGRWPSAQHRQCTSDLKRGPIEREVRKYLKEHPEHHGQIVNCMGLRAQESAARSRRKPLIYSERNSKAGRVWYDWLPIHDWSLEDVWSAIEEAQQEPHYAYGLGMSRLSCMFCILASKQDLQISAKANPEAYAHYVSVEKELDHTMSMSGQSLERVTGIKA